MTSGKTISDCWSSNAEVCDLTTNFPDNPDVQSEWETFQTLLNTVFRQAFNVVTEKSNLPDAVRLSPLILRVVSSGLIEKVLLLGSKSFSGPIGARNSTPCLHLRHKRKRLARLSELKLLHLLGVRSGSSDYRALLHTSPALSIPASLTWSASWTNSTPTSCTQRS